MGNRWSKTGNKKKAFMGHLPCARHCPTVYMYFDSNFNSLQQPCSIPYYYLPITYKETKAWGEKNNVTSVTQLSKWHSHDLKPDILVSQSLFSVLAKEFELFPIANGKLGKQ